MQGNPSHGLHADPALPQLFVTVLMGTAGVLAVVEMNRQQTIQADHLVKRRQYPIQVVYQIIAPVPHMAGIQADAQLVLLLHPVDDLPQLFKAAAHL